jgi:uncharacterized protein YvpB
MVIEYIKNYYGNPVFENMPDMNYDKIVSLCKTNPDTGTRINEELMREISSEINLLKLELKSGLNYGDLKDTIEKEIPCIVIYDGRYIKYQLRGPAHAGVVIGFTPLDEIVLNNPWYGSMVEFSKREFIDAWEIYGNSAVFIKLIPQTKVEDYARD